MRILEIVTALEAYSILILLLYLEWLFLSFLREVN